jgi:hypothetical protein
MPDFETALHQASPPGAILQKAKTSRGTTGLGSRNQTVPTGQNGTCPDLKMGHLTPKIGHVRIAGEKSPKNITIAHQWLA